MSKSINLNRELVCLILQYFNDEGFTEAARMLEHDSGLFFNMEYFEAKILNGQWIEAEKYLSGFTKFDDNRHSTKIFFEIRKQRFFDALDNKDRIKALDILLRDLKVFAPTNAELFKELTQLLTFDDIRDHEALAEYGDAEYWRETLMCELRKLIEANPLFTGKLKFPSIQSQRLRRLINQGLNWQHMLCTQPQPDPQIATLFVDHVCLPPEDQLFSILTDDNPEPSQNNSMPAAVASPSSKSDASTVGHSESTRRAVCFGGSTGQGLSNVYITSSSSQTSNLPDDLLESPLKENTLDSSEVMSNIDFPRTVARILHEGSSPTSMDFHPAQQAILLVGTDLGDLGLWEASSGEKLVSRNFKVWKIAACSIRFKTSILKDPCVSVKHIAWSPEGSLFGAAYSKHLVQIYSYLGPDIVQQQVEIDAHVGGVNDLAFSIPKDKVLAITCGDDKTIKVDGNIKAWVYDDVGPIVDYSAPGLGCTSMAYSSYDRRLFSCSTSKSGESFLVEWDESEGLIKRVYKGLHKSSSALVQFDIMKDQFLAVGDDHTIKIWDMDKVELFTTIDADGGLPANPCIRSNKDGTFLAVSANNNRIKILATKCDSRLLCRSGNYDDAPRGLSETFGKGAIRPKSSVASAGVANECPQDVDLKSLEGARYEFTGSINRKVFEINKPTQCHMLWLPKNLKVNKMQISGLIYNNAGNAILALTSNGTHLVWKWTFDDFKSRGKATTEVAPQLWQPRSSPGLMTNDLLSNSDEESLPCFALSNNDSYLLSASGGHISLYNLLTFKKMKSIMSPPPAPTSIAFLPQDNNIVAIGRDDSTILIYNARLSEVVSTLSGHFSRVSSLAFSKTLNVLVSSGADAQIFVWNVEGWKQHSSRFLQIPDKEKTEELLDTHVQSHQDQTQFLAANKTCIVIFEAKDLVCLKQWVPVGFAPIGHATFSCDGQIVYASLMDGSVCIFDASQLEVRSWITVSAYRPHCIISDEYPLVIAANPQKPSQFVVGLNNGGVVAFELLNHSGYWNTGIREDDGSESTSVIA